MLESSARLLRLLSLLEVRRDWSGLQLAQRLEVDTRTVRRDVDRLRTLGYPVESTPGRAGGYRLGSGAHLPPLLLDDDEAVAVAVSLRTAALSAVAGIEESSLRALTKLDQVLPAALRRRVRGFESVALAIGDPAATVDPAILTTVAEAARNSERLRFSYQDHDGAASTRTTEPQGLACTGRRWYLMA
ncbi:MAG TPA: HTH domain-containing protein, partial [Chloroflexota bacterium]